MKKYKVEYRLLNSGRWRWSLFSRILFFWGLIECGLSDTKEGAHSEAEWMLNYYRLDPDVRKQTYYYDD
jgi:hypothetical protein